MSGQNTTDPEQISNYLNNVFTNIAEQTLSSQPRIHNRKVPQLPASNHEQEMEGAIQILKPKISTGLDGISA